MVTKKTSCVERFCLVDWARFRGINQSHSEGRLSLPGDKVLVTSIFMRLRFGSRRLAPLSPASKSGAGPILWDRGKTKGVAAEAKRSLGAGAAFTRQCRRLAPSRRACRIATWLTTEPPTMQLIATGH